MKLLRFTTLLLRIANGAFALLFLYAAFLQHNDPDPVPWMLLYGLAAVACIRMVAKRAGWWLATAIGSVAVGWGAMLAPRVFASPPPPGALFGTGMLEVAVEEARELLGLLIVAAWMVAIAFINRPRASTAASAPPRSR